MHWNAAGVGNVLWSCVIFGLISHLIYHQQMLCDQSNGKSVLKLSSKSSLIIIECSRITAKSLWVWSNLVLEIVTYPAYKQLLDEVFVMSRIIEIEVEVMSRSRRLRLITLTETSIILDIKKPNLIIVLLNIERKNLVMFLLLRWRQAEQSARTWYDYPKKSCTAVIHNMITLSVLDMIIV